MNFYDNISKKETSSPKLLSFRRHPSVTSTDAYSEKDTASETEVTKAVKMSPLLPDPAGHLLQPRTGMQILI